MIANQSLIAELEEAIKSGSKDKRVNTLRRITDLFVADADRLNDQQIDVFDDVLGHLIKRVEARALAELSQRLGPIKNAPIDVVRRLARDDDIAVAEPVLRQSGRLSDDDLVEIADSKTQEHLLAISARARIEAAVTDALLRRGDRQVFHRLAENAGASFSEGGFTTLVTRAQRDEELAQKVGLRLDVPSRLFRELLLRATEAVRSRLIAVARPESRENIQRILSGMATDAKNETDLKHEQAYAEAHARMAALQANGELNEAVLLELARQDRHAELIAALSLLCGAPMKLVQDLLHSEHREAWLIPCKVAGLEWATVRAILNCRSIGWSLSQPSLDAAWADYQRLSQASAARVLRFWQVRQTAAKDNAPTANQGQGASPGRRSLRR